LHGGRQQPCSRKNSLPIHGRPLSSTVSCWIGWRVWRGREIKGDSCDDHGTGYHGTGFLGDGVHLHLVPHCYGMVRRAVRLPRRVHVGHPRGTGKPNYLLNSSY
jgi:hypothetical protein